MNTPSFVDGYHDEIQSFQLWLWLLLLMWFNGERWQISMLKVAQMVPLLSPLFSTWTAAAVDPVVIYHYDQETLEFTWNFWIMTVKSQLNSRKCLKMCWEISNLEFTWDFVNFRRLPAKPQLYSRSIDFTLTNLTFVNNIIHDLYQIRSLAYLITSQTPAEFQDDQLNSRSIDCMLTN